MDTVEFLAEIRPLEPQIGARTNDNTPDDTYNDTLTQLANLHEAFEAVSALSAPSPIRLERKIGMDQLSPLTRALRELQRRLLLDLPHGSVYQQAVNA